MMEDNETRDLQEPDTRDGQEQGARDGQEQATRAHQEPLTGKYFSHRDEQARQEQMGTQRKLEAQEARLVEDVRSLSAQIEHHFDGEGFSGLTVRLRLLTQLSAVLDHARRVMAEREMLVEQYFDRPTLHATLGRVMRFDELADRLQTALGAVEQQNNLSPTTPQQTLDALRQLLTREHLRLADERHKFSAVFVKAREDLQADGVGDHKVRSYGNYFARDDDWDRLLGCFAPVISSLQGMAPRELVEALVYGLQLIAETRLAEALDIYNVRTADYLRYVEHPAPPHTDPADLDERYAQRALTPALINIMNITREMDDDVDMEQTTWESSPLHSGQTVADYYDSAIRQCEALMATRYPELWKACYRCQSNYPRHDTVWPVLRMLYGRGDADAVLAFLELQEKVRVLRQRRAALQQAAAEREAAARQAVERAAAAQRTPEQVAADRLVATLCQLADQVHDKWDGRPVAQGGAGRVTLTASIDSEGMKARLQALRDADDALLLAASCPPTGKKIGQFVAPLAKEFFVNLTLQEVAICMAQLPLTSGQVSWSSWRRFLSMKE